MVLADRGSRCLLAVLAMAVAWDLTSASRDVRPSSEPIARPPELVLDPNTAPLHALAALPHIGPALARRLVEARTERPFASLDDLQDRVRGVGPVTLAQIAPYLQIDVAPGFNPRTLIASQGEQSARKSKSSRRKTDPIGRAEPDRRTITSCCNRSVLTSPGDHFARSMNRMRIGFRSRVKVRPVCSWRCWRTSASS